MAGCWLVTAGPAGVATLPAWPVVTAAMPGSSATAVKAVLAGLAAAGGTWGAAGPAGIATLPAWPVVTAAMPGSSATAVKAVLAAWAPTVATAAPAAQSWA